MGIVVRAVMHCFRIFREKGITFHCLVYYTITLSAISQEMH